jgi:hypothetical protein
MKLCLLGSMRIQLPRKNRGLAFQGCVPFVHVGYLFLIIMAFVSVTGFSSVAQALQGTVTEDTEIFEEPTFDSEVIAEVAEGARIPISKGSTGNEFGRFRKTRVDGKIGWIPINKVRADGVKSPVIPKGDLADPEPRPRNPKGSGGKPGTTSGGKPASRANSRETPEPATGTTASSRESRRKVEREIYLLTRYVGLSLGSTEFREGISGRDRTANVMTYGMKVSGPDTVLPGGVTDWNFHFHYGAPSYYDELSSVKPSGFLLMTDVSMLLPLRFSEDSAFILGAGPLLVMTSFQASQGSRRYDMFSIGAGLALTLGSGWRWGDYGLRVEGRYLVERKIHRGLMAHWQMAY